jgi:hypothetical protein
MNVPAAVFTAVTSPGSWWSADARVLELVNCFPVLVSAASELFSAPT